MDRYQVAALLASAAALSCLSIVLALHKNKKKPKPKLKKNGNPRKGRMPNRDRHRSLSNRAKLQALPDDEFASGCKMHRAVFEQLLALVEPVLARQTHRKRKLPRDYEQYDR